MGFEKVLPGQHFAELAAGRLHERRVEGAGHRDQTRGEAGRFELLDRGAHGVVGARNHGLARAVVIGQSDAVHACQRFGDRIGIGLHGGHGAGFLAGGVFDGAAAGFGKIEQRAVGDDARGGQSYVLAVAVARGHSGAHAQALESAAQGNFDHAQGGLRDQRIGQLQVLLLLALRS